MQATTRRKVALPKRSPVSILHVKAPSDVNGNPRRCFVVTAHRDGFVETIDEGYYGESAASGRYPWFNHSAARKHGLTPSYMQSIEVPASEYKRMMRRETDSGTASIRRRADRYERAYDAFGDER